MPEFIRIKVPLLPNESSALTTVAIQQRRRAEAQAAIIIRKELQRLGLIEGDERVGSLAAAEGEHGK